MQENNRNLIKIKKVISVFYNYDHNLSREEKTCNVSWTLRRDIESGNLNWPLKFVTDCHPIRGRIKNRFFRVLKSSISLTITKSTTITITLKFSLTITKYSTRTWTITITITTITITIKLWHIKLFLLDILEKDSK